MCGIAGIINFDKEKVRESSIRKMMVAMKHRGPDDEGIFLEDFIGLGFVRLSILDLSIAGHQPMISNDNRYIILLNGEVYNYLELRNELKSKYSFNSCTDTEVVLNAYIEWGEACLNRFNGMFAFVIYDKKEKQLFCARDRFGIKPFYYYQNSFQFIFASDFPSILEVMPEKPKANDEVIFNYLLTNRTNYSENTFFSGIRKIQAGHSIVIKDSKVEINRWYNVKNELKDNGFKTDSEYYECFKDSIKLQLRSDVPIGLSLSGGLDSSSIASVLLKDLNVNNLHSYSAIYDIGDIGDEQEFIQRVKTKELKMHFIKPSTEVFLKDLNEYIKALSEPIPGTSEYAEFKVMQLAKEHSTVVLNGQGADEVLGGYDYFYGAYLLELFRSFKIGLFSREIYGLWSYGSLRKTLSYFFYFLMPVWIQTELLNKRNKVINHFFYRKYKYSAISLLKKFNGFKTLQDFFINHLEYKFEHHLIWADKSGMHFSLETRFPFIDHRLIERSLATNINQILSNGWTKKILRDALLNKLPDDIRARKDKIGFETPEGKWIKQPDFINFINNIINSESFKRRPYFKYGKINKIFQLHLDGKSNYANIIWKAVHLELWLRNYIDKPVTSPDSSDNYKYLIITPVKNEAEFIKFTLSSIIGQSHLPKKWIIVDDGSDDETAKIVESYANKYSWIELLKIKTQHESRIGGSKIVRAFNHGYSLVNKDEFDFIVKLDGDLSLPFNYFERIFQEFKASNDLGICGGYIINKFSETDMRIERTNSFQVRGALKTIRRECWEQIGGFKEIWNWDGLDVMEARFNKWETKSIDLPVIHHRPTTSGYDPLQHAFKCGYESYKFGADLFLTILRCIIRLNWKPYCKVSLFFYKGYQMAKKNKEKLIVSQQLAKFIREFHYKRLNILEKI
jgi:asparagine synthase (glutamine-hydrolysing)